MPDSLARHEMFAEIRRLTADMTRCGWRVLPPLAYTGCLPGRATHFSGRSTSELLSGGPIDREEENDNDDDEVADEGEWGVT